MDDLRGKKSGMRRKLGLVGGLVGVFWWVLGGLMGGVKCGGEFMVRVKGRLLSVMMLGGLVVMVGLGGEVYAANFFTTNETTGYNWSAGSFSKTKSDLEVEG